MVNLKTTLCGIELDNPIIPASGTFGFGYEFAELYDINILGSLSFKGTTREARFGNPTPRIAECASGMLNAVGLQNPGVDKVISEELPKLFEVFNKPVMANVSGFSEEEYVDTVRKLDSVDKIGWFEVNISCPNVHGGGMSFGTSPEMAGKVTKAVRAVTKKPIIINDPTAIHFIADSCERRMEDDNTWNISFMNYQQPLEKSKEFKDSPYIYFFATMILHFFDIQPQIRNLRKKGAKHSLKEMELASRLVHFTKLSTNKAWLEIENDFLKGYLKQYKNLDFPYRYSSVYDPYLI